MTEITDFGLIVLAVSATVFAALLGMRLADRFSIPYAAIFFVGAAVLAGTFSSLSDLVSVKEVERLTVVALVVILFDGGLAIGVRRFRRSAGPILALGVVGTFATAGLVALAAHYLLGLDWILAGLVGAAIAPTDPAVTFSVFGSREIRGRAGTILEGEAGMNDPVGIALMIGMIELATEDDGSFATVVEEFVVEMAIGLAVGVVGALLLLSVLRRIRLTGPALYPIRVLAGAGIVYGLASVLGGSGFLAVFVAGIVLGDEPTPRRRDSEEFLSSLAGLAEIAAFVALGLTVGLGDLDSADTWRDGVVLALVLAFVARPLAVLPLLWPARLSRGERVFIAWGGLKGAVPILLGALALLAAVDGATHLYGIVFVVVLFSVIVQGASIPHVASRLQLPLVRVEHDLTELLEFVVGDRAQAAGSRVADLELNDGVWVGVLVRDGHARAVNGDVVLEAGDRVHVYCEPNHAPAVERLFAASTT